MSSVDIQYTDLGRKVFRNGHLVETRNARTKKIAFNTIEVDLEKEFAILTMRRVPWMWALIEMLWIYQQGRIDVAWLHERGNKFWDKFVIGEDGYYRNPDNPDAEPIFFGKEFAGTIGDTYGGPQGFFRMTEDIIYKLKHNPHDRRIMANLYQYAHIKNSVLPPCIHEVQFVVTGDKLNCRVSSRSSDIAVGLPNDLVFHAGLTHAIANDVGLIPGIMHFTTGDTHLYEKHFDEFEEMISAGVTFDSPKFSVTAAPGTSFFDLDNSKELKDFKLENYKYNETKYSFEVIP